MIAITTNSSISVNAFVKKGRLFMALVVIKTLASEELDFHLGEGRQ